MSVVAFGFGSFGDIATLLQIIVGTCKLLNDCYDATAQRQETIEYLFAFSNALKCLSPLCTSGETHVKPESQLPVATINAIRHSVDKCAQEIQRFHARVRTAVPPIDAHPTTTGSVARIHESLRWSLSLNAESLRLRRILAEQKGLIDTILAAQMTQNMLIRAELVARPLTTGYNPMTGLPNTDSITLIDVLNEAICVPIECCFSYQIFTEFLTFLFRERAAGAYIRAGLYKATAIAHRHKQRAVLNAKSWTSLVTPGTTIELAVLAQRRIHGLQFDPSTCPRCGGRSSADMWEISRQCTRCRNFISFSSPSSLIRHEEPSMLLADTNDWQFVRRFCYEVHVDDSPTPVRELYLQEALQYLNNMRDTVDAWTYQQFLDMVSAFHKQLINNEEMFQRLNVLLRACPRLVNMFCLFLPPGCCLEYTATPGSADVVRLTTTAPKGHNVTSEYPRSIEEASAEDAVFGTKAIVTKRLDNK